MTNGKIKRVCILTGGGDAPGLNAVIEGFVTRACRKHGWEVLGSEDGFEGLIQPPSAGKARRLDAAGVAPEPRQRAAQGGEVNDAGHSGEVLQQDPGRQEGDLLLAGTAGAPAEERVGLRGKEARPPLQADHRLGQDAHGPRQARRIHAPVRRQGGHAEEVHAPAVAKREFLPERRERVHIGSSGLPPPGGGPAGTIGTPPRECQRARQRPAAALPRRAAFPGSSLFPVAAVSRRGLGGGCTEPAGLWRRTACGGLRPPRRTAAHRAAPQRPA